ncbi:hypothetical protein FKM82_008355 [Ascaphus truei]
MVDAIVEFDYKAQHDDELTIAAGDIITKIKKEDGGWWEGELKGRRGLFPDNFVRVSTNSTMYSICNDLPTYLCICLPCVLYIVVSLGE